MWAMPLAPPPLSTSPTDWCLLLSAHMGMSVKIIISNDIVRFTRAVFYIETPKLVTKLIFRKYLGNKDEKNSNKT